MKECLFCAIIEDKARATVVHKDEKLVVIEDINPQAPTHLLIIPRKHIESVATIEPDDRELIGDLFLAAKKVAKERGVEKAGYRVVVNTNRGAGQSVFHLHLHVLGGRSLGWPPG